MPPGLLWINHFALTPDGGGGTRHFEMGRELVRRGWSVQIAAADINLHTRRYTRRAGADQREPIVQDVEGVRFIWLWAAPYEKNDWRRARNWVTFARSLLSWKVERGTIDVVIGSSPHLFAALAGERLARRLGVPFVLEVRDLWPESIIAAGGRKGPAYAVFAAMARYLYRRADRIVCLARGSMRHLEAMGIDGAKLVYVPNGVDTDAFTPSVRTERDTFTLVYAGAHGPANGLDVVLDAAALLRQDADIRFVLVGDGPSKPALQEQARAAGLDNVTFLDPVAKERIPLLFAQADAGLMVLRETPLFAFGVSPNKLFDYFGAALPVVCNVPGEVAGMMRDSGGGEQAGSGSAADLAAAVKRLRDRTVDERKRMGARAREWVTREHGRRVLAERLDGMLRELVRSV